MKKLTRLFSLLLIIGLVSAALPLPVASADTLTVCASGCDYTTIDAAVSAASTGDTINVAAGTYGEHVTIDKSLTLIGTGAIINGGGTGIVVLVTAPDVSISGFTITGSGLDPDANAGIGVILANGVQLSNNIISGNAGGVSLAGATNSIITGNQFLGNIIGVALTSWNTGTTFFATGNVIDGNIITGSMHSGIYGDQDCDGNTIVNNTISDGVGSADGIYLWKSAGNTITGNTITNNPQYGMQLMGSSNVIISGNTITGNLDGIRIRASGYPQEGTPDYHPFYPFNIGENTIENNKQFRIAIVVPLTLSDPPFPFPQTLQDVIDQAPDGATIFVPGSTAPYSLPGGFNINNDRLTIILGDGVVISNDGSPCFNINASHTRILTESKAGAKCVPHGSSTNGYSHGFEINNAYLTSIEDIVIDGLEIDGSNNHSGAAFYILPGVTDLQILNNYVHDLYYQGASAAMTLNMDVNGVFDIMGNLFQNTGPIELEEVYSPINATYNGWGVQSVIATDVYNSWFDTEVDFDPWTHVELFLDSSGTPWTDQVVNGQTITYTVSADLVNITGADFTLKYNPVMLDYLDDSVTTTDIFDPMPIDGSGGTAPLVAVDEVNGVIKFAGWVALPDAPVTGEGLDLFSVTFTALKTGTSDVFIDPATDEFAMSPASGPSNNVYAAALGAVTVNAIVLPTITSTDIQGYYLTGDEQGFSVSLNNPLSGGTYTGVMVDIKISNADPADITSLYYWETASDPDAFALLPLTSDGLGNLVGTFGPPTTGFPMSAPYSATTPFKVTFANGGSYPVELNLRDVATGEILTTFTDTAVVYEKPVITSDDLAGPYLVNVPEPVTLTITNPSLIPGPFSLVFDLPAGTTIVYGGSTYTCDTTICQPIPVTLPLTSNELLFTFTFTAPYNGDISATLFDSDWTPAPPRELATLSVNTGAYENYPVTGSFIIEYTTPEYGFNSFNAYYTGIPVTLTRVGTPAFTTTSITTALDGTNIQFTNVMTGTYEITTNMPRVLNIFSGTDETGTMHKTIEITEAELITPLVLIRGNAIWTDNKISILDAVQVATTYGQTGDLAGDVNFDGKVSIGDLTTIGGNYSLTSYGVYLDWTP